MRSRAWTLTINNPQFSDLVQLLEVDCRYVCFGFEHHNQEGKTPHIQGYIYFDEAKSLQRVKQHFPRAHCERVRGTVLQNAVYTSKEGDWYEFGDVPDQGRASFEVIEEAMKNPEENFQVYHQYRKSYRELKASKIDYDKTRQLYIMPDVMKYEVMRTVRASGATVCVYPSDYDGESVYITPAYDKDQHVVEWKNGNPITSFLGYEKKVFDPDIVYKTYSCPNEATYLQKKYVELIDDVYINK